MAYDKSATINIHLGNLVGGLESICITFSAKTVTNHIHQDTHEGFHRQIKYEVKLHSMKYPDFTPTHRGNISALSPHLPDQCSLLFGKQEQVISVSFSV